MKKIKVSQDVLHKVSEKNRKMVIEFLCSEGIINKGDELIPDPSLSIPKNKKDFVEKITIDKESREDEDCVDDCFDAAVLLLAVCEANGGLPQQCSIAADKLYSKCVEHC